MGVRSWVIGCLKRFVLSSRGSIPQSQEQPPLSTPPIQPDEILTRFVTDREHYKTVARTVHWRGFLPSKSDPDELSISRISGKPEDEIWRIGEEVGAVSNRTIHARGDFVACQLDEVRLADASSPLSAMPDPPPDHQALIIGWPTGDLDAVKSLAQQLAAKVKGSSVPVG
jgi:hypothetical protein